MIRHRFSFLAASALVTLAACPVVVADPAPTPTPTPVVTKPIVDAGTPVVVDTAHDGE